jgi:tetratricopeptide (TPR) repeat protein
VLAAAVVSIAGVAWAGSTTVQYGPAPAWVLPPPSPTATAPPPGAAFRVAYSDFQTSLGPDGSTTYSAFRIKILSPQALALGNVGAVWNPSTDDITIHTLRIIRGDQVIDVLKDNKFQVIQRENNLEYSMLDGALTGTLQTPGLQVGDEVEFAMTVHRRETLLGGRSYGGEHLPQAGVLGAHRIRLVWHDGGKLRWQASADLGQTPIKDAGTTHEIVIELRDPGSPAAPEGAPARYAVRRSLEYSEFASWRDVSNAVWPLFDQAEKLAPGSAVKAEAARIAAATSDPVARTEAALKLAQDQIRYVYVGLNGGNYRPASADETWTRRFGDCKAKTVLLLALLRELGVQSEAVLVNSKGADGADQRLPSPEVFDHVVVKATIEGRTYWLDGTRLDDHRLSDLSPLPSRWGLPLRETDADLERIPIAAPVFPLESDLIFIDASAGFDTPAKIEMEQVLRGDEAEALRLQLAAQPPDDVTRALEESWSQGGWTATSAQWRYDETQKALIVVYKGSGKQDWEGDEGSGRNLAVPHAGQTPPAELHRPADQDQTAPWQLEFPNFKRWTTVIELPAPTRKWRYWSYLADPMRLRLGGVSYWRQAQLQDGMLRTTMSRRTLSTEISPADARAMNAGLPHFNNRISELFQSAAPGNHPEPSGEPTDPDAQHFVALAQQADGASKTAEALADLDQAVAAEPEASAIFVRRSALLHKLGRDEEAARDLTEAWRINPLDPQVAKERDDELRIIGQTAVASQFTIP